MSANNDVAQAIQATWSAANLSAANGPVPGGLIQLPIPRGAVQVKPYATLEVKKDGKPNQFQSDGQYWDYRRVKIVLYGIGQTAIGGVVSQVLAALWKTAAAWIPLVIPNASWLRTEYVSDDINLEEPVAGDDIRSAPLEFIVWSQRKTG
jgi:hypothetical protein